MNADVFLALSFAVKYRTGELIHQFIFLNFSLEKKIYASFKIELISSVWAPNITKNWLTIMFVLLHQR